MIKEKAPVREHRGFSKRTTKSCIRRCIFMGKRTNTAKWMENQRRWQINVQKDGVRRSFTSSKPGRTGQREAKDHPGWLAAPIQKSLSSRISACPKDSPNSCITKSITLPPAPQPKQCHPRLSGYTFKLAVRSPV